MSKDPIRLPTGVRDFLPRAASRRRFIAQRLMSEFEAWGYRRIVTPWFERDDVLERGVGDDARATAIRFIEPSGGEVVALRPDITPQVARLAATRLSEVKGPLRLCYEGTVARLSRGARGQREILQTGVELVGAAGPAADAELLALALATLELCPQAERSVDVGHVALARLALDRLEGADERHELIEALRRKDAAAVAASARTLPLDLRALVEALPRLFGDPTEVLQHARSLSLPARASEALDELEHTLELASIQMPEHSELMSSLTLDLGELRGFEYYTGMRLSAYVRGAGHAVLRGGRYDELIGCYGEPRPATGFAVDVEALAEAEAQAGVDVPPSATGVLVCAQDGDHARASQLAAGLREQGFRACLHIDGALAAGEGAATEELVDYAGQVELSAVLLLKGRKGRIVSISGAEQELSASVLDQAASRSPGVLSNLILRSA